MTDASQAGNMDKIVQKYIELRDLKTALKKKFDADTAIIDEGMEKIEAYLLNKMNKDGVDSIGTASGTAYVQTKTSAGVEDWDTALAFIKETGAWGMLVRNVSKDYVVQFKEEHKDLPPGIKWSEFRQVNIRRPTK